MDEDASLSNQDARNLRFLRVLVTVLTAIMILGVLTIITLLVIRLRAPDLPLPAEITLPDGTTATAFTQGADWYAIVTSDDRILIYDRSTGALTQEIAILP